jgi:hypothetical protein
MTFDGSKEVGSGQIQILKTIPNQQVELELHMTAPFEATNQVVYELKTEGTATRFTWHMSGKNNLIGKIIGVFIDCEKMVTPDFDKGIQNLKQIVENQAHS